LRWQESPKKPKQSYRSRVRRHVLTEPATAILAEIAEELVRVAHADHPDEKTVSLLAISLSHLEQHWKLQLELPLGLEDEKRRPGSQRGMARWTADRAIDLIRISTNLGAVRARSLIRFSRGGNQPICRSSRQRGSR
jgi:hypothetical protein